MVFIIVAGIFLNSHYVSPEPDQKLKKLLENEGEGHCVSSMENYPLEIGEA